MLGQRTTCEGQFSVCGTLESNSHGLTWQQVPLPSEPSLSTHFFPFPSLPIFFLLFPFSDSSHLLLSFFPAGPGSVPCVHSPEKSSCDGSRRNSCLAELALRGTPSPLLPGFMVVHF